MIEALSIKNFQSHVDTELKFNIGVNVLFGLSHCGKSAVIRSFEALFFRNDFFLRNFTNDGHISLKLSDYALTRFYSCVKTRKCPQCKSKIDETMQICSCGEVIQHKMSSDYYKDADKEYRSFGMTIPQEMLTKLKIFPIKFVDFEECINIFNQHDDMFFVGKSYGGQVRNKIISSLLPDSNKVDVLIKNLNSEILSKTSEQTYLLNEKVILEAKIAKATPFMEVVDKLQSEVDALVAEFETYDSDITLLKKLEAQLKLFLPAKKVDEKLPTVNKFAELINKKLFELETLNTSIENLEEIQKLLSTSNKANIQLQEFKIPEIEEYEKLLQEILDLDKQRRVLINLKTDTIVYSAQIVDYMKTEAEIQKKLDSFYDVELCPITKKEYCKECKDILKGKK